MSHALYQDIILKHSRHPQNCHTMDDATAEAEGYNKVCGDYIKVFVKIEGDVIKDISFYPECCAICKASADLMCTHLKGETGRDAQEAVIHFKQFLDSKTFSFKKTSLLNGFKELRSYPSRIPCALLPWETLQQLRLNL